MSAGQSVSKEEIQRLSGDTATVEKQFCQYRDWTRRIDAAFLLIVAAMFLSFAALPMPYPVIVFGGCVIATIGVFRVWKIRRRQVTGAVMALKKRIDAAERLALNSDP